jgi:hypothetical protein
MNEKDVKSAFYDELEKIAVVANETTLAGILKGLASSMGYGKSVKGAGETVKNFVRGSKGDLAEKVRHKNFPGGVHSEADAEDLVNSIGVAREASDARWNKGLGIAGAAATGLGMAHTVGAPLLRRFTEARAAAEQSGIQKRIFAGLGIGAGGAIGASALANLMSRGDSETTYTL